MSNDNFFDKYGLEISSSSTEELEEGKTYPLFGVITGFITEDLESGVIVEVNSNLVVKLLNINSDNLELLKKKAFESGIFLVTLLDKGNTETDDRPIFECSKIIFGRPQAKEV